MLLLLLMGSHVRLSLRPVIRQLRWLMGSSDARDCNNADGAGMIVTARRWVAFVLFRCCCCCCSLARSRWTMWLSLMRLTSGVENSRVLLDGSRGPPALKLALDVQLKGSVPCSTKSAPTWHGVVVLNLTLLSRVE